MRLVNEFQRLIADESNRLKLEWNLQRTLAKVNYRIHTDAIKENLIPEELSKEKVNFVYADEADMLNVALFGITANQWRDTNPKADGNIRDAATIEQLVLRLKNYSANLNRQTKNKILTLQPIRNKVRNDRESKKQKLTRCQDQ